MRGKATAAVVGYLTLAVVYIAGALIAWIVLPTPPFASAGGDLTGAWRVGLALDALAASFLAGWVCRRLAGGRGAVILLAAVLIGLWIIVVATDSMIGPTPSSSAFLEHLVGSAPADLPFGALLQGRPSMGFVVTSYVLAVVGILVGSWIAEGARGTGGTSAGSA